MKIVKTRVDRLKKSSQKHVLSDQDCKEYLDLQKRFVLVPADKVVLIVCKKYYLDIVLKELDTCSGTSPQTYTPCSTSRGKFSSRT